MNKPALATVTALATFDAAHADALKALDVAHRALLDELRGAYDTVRAPFKALGLDTGALDHGAQAMDDDAVGDGSEHVQALAEAKAHLKLLFGAAWANVSPAVVRFERLVRLSFAYSDAVFQARHPDRIAL